MGLPLSNLRLQPFVLSPVRTHVEPRPFRLKAPDFSGASPARGRYASHLKNPAWGRRVRRGLSEEAGTSGRARRQVSPSTTFVPRPRPRRSAWRRGSRGEERGAEEVGRGGGRRYKVRAPPHPPPLSVPPSPASLGRDGAPSSPTLNPRRPPPPPPPIAPLSRPRTSS